MYAFVTGATSGIGREIVKILAGKKYNLIIVGRRIDRLKELKKELEKQHNINVVCFQCDLSDEKQCKELLTFLNDYKDIEVAINSAGFGKVGYVNKIDEKDELNMIKTNVIALHLLSKYFAQTMKKGNIVNISSIAGTLPVPYMNTYGATKAYVNSFSLALGYEMKKLKKDVKVTSVCPGPVDTEFNDIAGCKYKLKSITVKKCAKDIVKAMEKGKIIQPIGFVTKVLYYLSKITPYKIILPIEYGVQIKKKED